MSKVLERSSDRDEPLDPLMRLVREGRQRALASTDTVWEYSEGVWAPRSGTEAASYALLRDGPEAAIYLCWWALPLPTVRSAVDQAGQLWRQGGS